MKNLLYMLNSSHRRGLKIIVSLVFCLLLAGTVNAGYVAEGAVTVADTVIKHDKKCPAFTLPSLQYNYNRDLEHGIYVAVKSLHIYPGCDCDGSFGGLCYFGGPTYRLSAGYYPGTKTGDIGASTEFRFFPAFAGLTGGYAFSGKSGLGKDFLYVGPTAGLDILFGQLSVGYLFRTQKVNGRAGGFTFSVIISPFGDKKFRTARKSVSRATPDERKNLRKR